MDGCNDDGYLDGEIVDGWLVDTLIDGNILLFKDGKLVGV